MKVKVTVDGDIPRPLARHIGVLSASARRRLAAELRHELQSVRESERAADPETRRDALERAVRRIWGATL